MATRTPGFSARITVSCAFSSDALLPSGSLGGGQDTGKRRSRLCRRRRKRDNVVNLRVRNAFRGLEGGMPTISYHLYEARTRATVMTRLVSVAKRQNLCWDVSFPQ
jgi:hypothetical protein